MLTRRDFLKVLSTFFLASFVPSPLKKTAHAKQIPQQFRGMISVAYGKDKTKLIAAALGPLGGV